MIAVKNTLKIIISTVLTLILFSLSFKLILDSLFSTLIPIKNLFYFFGDYNYPWLFTFQYNFLLFMKAVISISMLYFLFSLTNYKSKIDRYNIKWLKIPFYAFVFSFIVIYLIRLSKNQADAFSSTLFSHEETATLLVLYFFLYIGQNFISFLRNFLLGKYIYIFSMPLIFYYWWYYLAREYHKQRILKFLFEDSGF